MLCYTVVLSVSSDEACDKQLAIQSSTGLCHTATADTHYHRSVSAPSSAPWRTRYLTTDRQTDRHTSSSLSHDVGGPCMVVSNCLSIVIIV